MIKEVLRLHHCSKLNNTQISKALGCSRGAVAEYLHRANAAGLLWPLPLELDDAQLERRLFPPIARSQTRPLPDFNYIHTELKKKGVILLQLWSEYKEEHPDGYGFSQFCEHYSRFEKKLNLVMRQEHKAGDKAFSDFAGKTLPITNPITGEIQQAHLFVCTLGASGFTFIELFSDETTESWCNGHAAAFSYFDGSPRICVPDNPKPVITKACPYEPDVNPSFAQMAAHYNVAVLPARVRKPKDKAKVEAAVGLATRWVLAVLRNRTFFSLAEARAAVRELLNKLNDRPFKKISGSRRSLYETIDRPALKPLPIVPYEYAHHKKASVGMDYHVEYEKHFYSVPYQLRDEVVELRVTSSTIEIFFKGKRITSHPRSSAENKSTTIKEHRPANHRAYGDCAHDKITAWAQKIGPSAVELVSEIMRHQKLAESAYRTCIGILRLSKKFEDERLEAACARALAINARTFSSVRSILNSNLDQHPLPEKPNQLSIVHANIRGAQAFQSHVVEGNHVDTSDNRQSESAEVVWHGQSTRNSNGTEGGS